MEAGMDFLKYFALLPGLMLGMLVVSRLFRWGYSLWSVVEERNRDPVHRSLWRIPAILLLDSGPWLFVAASAFAYFVLRSGHAEAWNWFFGGTLLASLILGLTVYRVFRRVRRAKQKGAAR